MFYVQDARGMCLSTSLTKDNHDEKWDKEFDLPTRYAETITVAPFEGDDTQRWEISIEKQVPTQSPSKQQNKKRRTEVCETMLICKYGFPQAVFDRLMYNPDINEYGEVSQTSLCVVDCAVCAWVGGRRNGRLLWREQFYVGVGAQRVE